MKKKVFPFCLLICLFSSEIQAQLIKKNAPRDAFRSSQAYIGLFAGPNFSNPGIDAVYSDFSMINAAGPDLLQDQKSYEPMSQNSGVQLGISGVFTLSNGISVAFSPAYQVTQYSYQSQFVWEDVENQANYLEFNFDHQQRLHYMSLPLLIRYAPLKAKLQPYIQIGAHYDRLLNAQKNVSTQGLDRASGGEVEFNYNPQSSEIGHLYINSHFGLIAGAGITYNLGTLIFSLDGQYRFGMHSITNGSTRFSGSRDLPGFGNVMDDISIRNVQITLGCYFPLKFLTKDFSPVIL